MATVIPFPGARRRGRRSVPTPLFPAEVQPFPLTRYAGEVERLARHLGSLPTSQQRSAAMEFYVDRAWQRLCDICTDCDALENIFIDFIEATWAEVRRREYGGAA